MRTVGRYIDCRDGLRLWVEDEGQGPATLLLHGFTGSGATLQAVVDGLGMTRRFIRPDLLGHGASDAPTDPDAYRMERCLARLEDLLDALEVEMCDVIGYSMGGRVGLSLGVAFPERVRSLVLIGASPGLAKASDREARRVADEAWVEGLLSRGLEWFVAEWMALPLFATQSRLGEAALLEMKRQRLACRAEGLAGSLRGLGTGSMPPLHEALSKLKQPVLLVTGAEDQKFSAIAKEMEQSIANAERFEVPGAGHAPHLEEPSSLNPVLCQFLDRVSRFSSDREPK